VTSVLIVGAGIMGSAIARELAHRGCSVRVLEKSIPGAEASSVAAGILAPHVEHDDGPLRALGIASRDAYESLAQSLREETGIDVGFVRSGVLVLSNDVEIGRQLAVRYDGWLDARDVRRLEPALGDGVVGGWRHADEAQVDPPHVLRALVQSAERSGARFTSGAAVTGLARRGDRIVGVETDHGVVDADHVILAAGAWTSRVPGLPRVLASAVSPVRGQLLRAELRAPIVRHILYSEAGYIVPRPDGRVVIGATMEEAGFTKEVTLGAVATLSAHATRIVPALASARFVEADVSFRPASIDGLPLIGRTALDGLWLATGHFRNGILLAPATATMIASLITDSTPAHDPRPFDPRRLGDAA
jgi:glycine oxidase